MYEIIKEQGNDKTPLMSFQEWMTVKEGQRGWDRQLNIGQVTGGW